MKLVQVLLGQVVRLASQAQLSEQRDGTHYVIDFVRALQSKYKFVEVPTKVDEFDFAKGLKFRRGWYARTTIIDSLEIYNSGIIVDGKHATEVLDEFSDSLIDWTKQEFGLAGLHGPSAYLSNIEFQSEIGLGNKFEFLTGVGRTITAMLEQYGQKPNPFRVTQIGFHADTTNVPFPVAPNFQIDRRGGKPDSEKLYFCTAPLKTADQLKVLETLEAIFGG